MVIEYKIGFRGANNLESWYLPFLGCVQVFVRDALVWIAAMKGIRVVGQNGHFQFPDAQSSISHQNRTKLEC